MQGFAVLLIAILSISIAKALDVAPWGLQPTNALALLERYKVDSSFADAPVWGLAIQAKQSWYGYGGGWSVRNADARRPSV